MKRVFSIFICICLLIPALPAAAFTEQHVEPVTLEIRLAEPAVDVMDGQFFPAPAAGRKFVRNEVLAAVVSMHVPKGMDPVREGYRRLLIRVEGGSVDIPENFPQGQAQQPVLHYSEHMPPVQVAPDAARKGFSIFLGNAGADGSAFRNTENDRAYSFAFFFKLTEASASISARLTGNAFLPDATDMHKSHLQLHTERGVLSITRNGAPLIQEGALHINKAVYTVTDAAAGYTFQLVANRDTDRLEDLILCATAQGGELVGYRMAAGGQDCFVQASPIWNTNAPLVAQKTESSASGTRMYKQLQDTYDMLVQGAFGLNWPADGGEAGAVLAGPLLQEDIVAELVMQAAQ